MFGITSMTLVRNRGGCSLTNFFSPAAGLTPHTEDTHVESLFACTVYTIGRHGRTRAAKDVRINRKEPPKLRSAGAPLPCGGGVAGPLEIGVILPNLVVLGQTVRALLRRSAWKIRPLASRNSRSLKVTELTRIDLQPVTSSKHTSLLSYTIWRHGPMRASGSPKKTSF